uniref:Cytochrome P450 3033B1 n=1 Tax=Paracyclopina nana TaxID=565004 RepID=A0A0F7IZX9_PARNA|nr:cytochrome P450 3033B1 [Paracyclopina nana]
METFATIGPQINPTALYFEAIFLFFLVIYAALRWLKYYGVPENFPPGPPCVPFLGVLPFIKGDFKAALQEWRETYGDIVGIKLGNELAVVLSDYKVIAAAFNDDRCAGRPKNLRKIMHAFFASQHSEQTFLKRKSEEEQPTFTSSGIVFAHGPDWVEQRRFSLRTLRDRGFGKSAMEHAVLEEVKKLTDLIDKKLENNKGETSSLDLSKDFSISVVNSLWSILTGEKIALGDKRVSEIIVGTGKFIRRESMMGAIMIYPWLRHLPFFNSQFSHSKNVGPLKMRQMQDEMVAMKQKRRESRKETLEERKVDYFDGDGLQNDFIDEYLSKVDSCRNRKSSFFGGKGVFNLQRTLSDLFGAGSETTADMMLFAFLYMIKHPDIQNKVHEEIDKICGARTVRLADKPLMSYVEATIMEILRHTCLVYTVPHSTTDDLEIDGYALPKETAIYANMWHVMRDPDYWEDPDTFRPERFLDEFGNYKSDDRNIPFMIGKRVCIGQSVAKNSLFLFFTSILQRYELKAPNGPDSIKTDPIVGFIHYCPSYNVEISHRPNAMDLIAEE